MQFRIPSAFDIPCSIVDILFCLHAWSQPIADSSWAVIDRKRLSRLSLVACIRHTPNNRRLRSLEAHRSRNSRSISGLIALE
jgi:hypothetical protein